MKVGQGVLSGYRAGCISQNTERNHGSVSVYSFPCILYFFVKDHLVRIWLSIVNCHVYQLILICDLVHLFLLSLNRLIAHGDLCRKYERGSFPCAVAVAPVVRFVMIDVKSF